MDRFVVVGGGVIGASICYYLTEKGHTNVTLIERYEIACHASGKAGGFLARGWGSGPTEGLHELSFDLIESLAKKLNIASYRKITTLKVSERKGKNVASWLNSSKVSTTIMDPETAQVTPRELTNTLIEAAKTKGLEVIVKTVSGIEFENETVTGIKFEDGTTLQCSKCVISMGAWSTIVGDWIGNPKAFPMDGILSSSLSFSQGMEKLATEEPYALFCDDDRNGCHLEVYPRPNNEVYICGCGGSDHVRGDRLRVGGDCDRPELIKPNPARIKAACASFQNLTDYGKNVEPDVAQACMRPCPPDGLPYIGKVSDYNGLYMAAGHNCWGILWSAATGLLVSELLLDQPLSLDISSFSPDRYILKKDNRGRHKNAQSVGEQW